MSMSSFNTRLTVMVKLQQKELALIKSKTT